MSAPAQSGLFAIGVVAEAYELPHPQLPLPVILVVRRVLLHAFKLLRERHGSLRKLKEDEITMALHAIIENDLRRSGVVPGFDGRTFESVERQCQVVNYSFQSIGKTPDLRFKLRRDEGLRRTLSAQLALFVECKPVDDAHPPGKEYCAKGIQRFVDGDYAWAMQDALMIGYARQGRTIAKNLTRALESHRELLRVAAPPAPVPMAQGETAFAGEETLHWSRHRREFEWCDGKGRACDIVVYHSWHCCD